MMRRLFDRIRNLILVSRHELMGKRFRAVQVRMLGRRWALVWPA
jgi:hypothetical protein